MPGEGGHANLRLPHLVRAADAELLDTFLVSAVATVLVIRIFLEATGYPQLGGGGLHSAHVLWGGLGMNLLPAQPFAFLDTGFGAAVDVFIDLALLATLRYMQAQERRLLVLRAAPERVTVRHFGWTSTTNPRPPSPTR